MGEGDGLEMLMVGSSASLCSVLLLKGLEYLLVLIKDLERHFKRKGALHLSPCHREIPFLSCPRGDP